MKNIFCFIFILLMLNSCIDSKVEEVVVIGGGLMGSSSAWQLSRAGAADQDEIALMGEEVTAGEVADERFVDRRVVEGELIDLLG